MQRPERVGVGFGARGWRPALLLVVAAGALARVPGLFTDFWLDEIWGLQWATGIRWPWQVFTAIHFDTNHWLYSLYLHALGGARDWPWYRLPALAAGWATIPLAAHAVRRAGAAARWLAAVLAAWAFVLIFYSTEARGYAFMVCLALGAYAALQDELERPAARTRLVFGVCASLGVLSHLTFLFALAAFGAWALAGVWRARPGWAAAGRRLAGLFVLPGATYAALYWFDLRYMRHGGADPMPLADAVTGLVNGTFGLPPGVPAWGSMAAVAGLGGVALVWLARRDPARALFFATVLVGAPALFVLRERTFTYWLPRHFLVAVPFLLVLRAEAGAAWAARGPRARVLVAALAALLVLGNGWRTACFWRDGRGGYLAAMQAMAAGTAPGAPVRVAADHDFRTLMMLRYYAPRLPGARFAYYAGGLEADEAEWLLVHAQTRTFQPPATYRAADGRVYRLQRVFPMAGYSGWHWALYRRPPSGTAGP